MEVIIMALSILLIMFICIAIVSILGISLLYLIKNPKTKNFLFYFLSIWSILVTFINITSLPTNFVLEKILALCFGILAIISVIIKIKKPEKSSLAYLLISISILLQLFDLFLF